MPFRPPPRGPSLTRPSEFRAETRAITGFPSRVPTRRGRGRDAGRRQRRKSDPVRNRLAGSPIGAGYGAAGQPRLAAKKRPDSWPTRAVRILMTLSSKIPAGPVGIISLGQFALHDCVQIAERARADGASGDGLAPLIKGWLPGLGIE